MKWTHNPPTHRDIGKYFWLDSPQVNKAIIVRISTNPLKSLQYDITFEDGETVAYIIPDKPCLIRWAGPIEEPED